MNPHKDSAFDLFPALFGSLVTVTHGYLNAKWFAQFGKHLAGSASDRWRWLRTPWFMLGLLLYTSGFTMVVYHDFLLRNMRTPGGPRYVRHWPVWMRDFQHGNNFNIMQHNLLTLQIRHTTWRRLRVRLLSAVLRRAVDLRRLCAS